MNYTINGQLVKTDQYQLTVVDVLEQQKFDNFEGIAVAINDSVIPSASWSKTPVNPSDKILIITAAQGG